ncbi:MULTISPECIES: glycosyltransferase [Cyanophyceae]|uniref:glycosyltransferase n=1 Tax=Cyanophyceae TaxID=3028117 RepID=UPI0016838739|nr:MULTISPECIES: glycosyltransferase [Cyanophyceae]MBD1918196.1 glycosyltransferase [Phormidium sp. FACHB-77]MBD2030228.1 glycosyltransferase [Phormidium sp. FACHB-322]MBD2051400.1 glycosyltransferase [Leptolyngbya sp. FACHB-60]
MRILSVHNTYQIRGGEDESRESEERLLRDHGHEVDVYEASNDRIGDLNPAQLALRTIWSQPAYRDISDRLAQKPYDIVHIQNFFPLISPSAHYAAKAAGVPVVQTLRNYRLLCPNGLFFRNGQVCEDCMGKPIPYPGALHGCYRESKAASAVVTAMIATHRALNTWSRAVDVFITLTEFSRQKFIQGGFAPEQLVVKPNFVAPDPGVGTGTGNYALYVGRLSVEKGLDTLLDAWEQLDTPIPLKIVGDGPLKEMVEKAAYKQPQIEWLGRQLLPEVHRLMGEAKCLVFPSKWYETFGRVAVEAFAKGTPVVAAKIGAIEELVGGSNTGILFEPGNASDLANQLSRFWFASAAEHSAMRRAVRAEFEQKYTATANYKALIDIYTKVCSVAH